MMHIRKGMRCEEELEEGLHSLTWHLNSEPQQRLNELNCHAQKFTFYLNGHAEHRISNREVQEMTNYLEITFQQQSKREWLR